MRAAVWAGRLVVGAMIWSTLPAVTVTAIAASPKPAAPAATGHPTPAKLAAAAPTYPVGKSPAAIVIRDFNGDGIPDVVAANSGDNTLSLLLGNGDGTFKPATSIAVGVTPVTLVAGDFNGDGHLDLAVGNQGSPANGTNTGASIQILLGDGHGAFTTKATYATGAFAAPAELVSGDFNKDGKLDLYFASAAWVGSNQAQLLMLGNGDGTFQAQTYAFGCAGFGLSVGDFNNDGFPEVASTEAAPSDVCVAIYNPVAGTWTRNRVVVRAYPASTAIADFNGDGKLDLVVGSNTLPSGSASTVSVTLGNGDLTFGAAATYTVATPNGSISFPQSTPATTVTTGDFSGDGKPDIAVATPGADSVSILINRGDGTFAGPSSYPVGSVPVAIAQFDLDNDGKLDLVTVNSGSNTVSVLLNPSATVGMQPTAVSFADQLVGTTSASQTVTLTNFGTTSVSFTGAALGGASPSSFTITADRCTGHTVLAGGTCGVDVAFAPPARIDRGTAILNVTDTAGGSPQSVLLSGTGDNLPGPPTNVTASFSLDINGYWVVVRWDNPADNGGAPLQSFTVTSSPPGLSTMLAAPGYNVVTFTNFVVGTTYTFKVTATNVVGTGPPSAASNPVTPVEPPGAPLNVAAVPDDGAAFVTWSPPATDGGAGIGSYAVTWWTGGVQGSTLTVTGVPPATNLFVTGLTNGTAYYFTVTATNVAGTGKPSQPSNTVTPIQGGNFHSLAPARVLDTRDGTGAATGPLPNQGVLHVQITGRGGVPSTGVSAVVMNVTVANPTAAGFLTVYPTGVSRPTASNLNFVAGQTVPNLVEVAVGNRGLVDVYALFDKTSGSADVIFDIAGWVGVATNSSSKEGLYNPLTPARILDTRSGVGAPKAPIGPDQFITLQVTGMGTGTVPASGVSAVILNVTVTSPTAPSYLTVYPADAATRPTVSNLNFVAGQTVPNRVIVKLSALGQVRIYNPAGSVHVIADVGGWFTDQTSAAGGARFSGVVPFRFFDSRTPGAGGPLRPGDIGVLQVLHQNGQPALELSAVVINITVTDTTAPSYLTLWPDGSGQPTASDLNWVGGQTVPNLVVVKLGTMNAAFDVYNAAGSTDVVVDLVGIYGSRVAAPAGLAAQPYSIRVTRSVSRSPRNSDQYLR